MTYLTDHKPAVQQWYAKRNRPLTGCTVLHTAESVMDSVGPDTGAEAVAAFIASRTTAGSYHDLVDSDSWIPLVPLECGAFHDGTGSNNWALSISFACRTSDWRAITSAQLDGFLAQGARAFAAQQAWRRAHGYPLTELRLISKAASDRGESGFTYHGWRDPGRRSDPGVAAPNLFPIDRFIEHCRAALAGTTLEEDDLSAVGDAILAKVTKIEQYMDVEVRPAVQDIKWMLKGGNPDGQNNFHWLAGQITEAIRTIPGAQVDTARLEAALRESVTLTEQGIATAVNDMADARDRDGDPATGAVPTSS